ncbi:hypothetical protein BDW75DRAFT_38032 [Aspergillus navahoensis]
MDRLFWSLTCCKISLAGRIVPRIYSKRVKLEGTMVPGGKDPGPWKTTPTQILMNFMTASLSSGGQVTLDSCEGCVYQERSARRPYQDEVDEIILLPRSVEAIFSSDPLGGIISCS